MRTLQQAKASWQELAQYTTVRELKDAVRLENRSSVATCGLRSFCWKTFLLFDTLDVAVCLQTLASSRSAYNTLRAHFLRSIDNPDDIGSGFDPLTQDAEKDEELRKEILQDVERCMPEHDYFRKAEVQRMLLDVLFVFCKLNPDVGYRQGMHELLAPVLWVIQDDAVDFGEGSKALGEDVAIANMYDAEHIEHDAFAVFGQIMQSSKSFYISDGPGSIASRSRYIFDDLLPQVDPELKKHLDYLEVVPQVYLIRWIRLLFGREFDFSSVLLLWDAIFAEDASLEVVDFICVAMLLRIRWDVMDADYNGVLGLLLRYPEPDRAFPAQTLVFDALHLRTNLNRESGSALAMKYTGRPLLRPNRPITPPALQRNITAFSGFATRRGTDRKGAFSPPRPPIQARNLEAMLRNTAKSIHARSEKLGIGKAVRNAVEEVHRKAQEIRETQVASPPAGWRRGVSGGSDGQEAAQLLSRIHLLESRNKRLSELLAGAVGELWEYQKLAADGTGEAVVDANKESAIEKLSAAIAQVQFVQVYLDEPSLALVEQGASDAALPVGAVEHLDAHSAELAASSPQVGNAAPLAAAAAEKEAIDEKGTRSFHVDGLADPSTFDDLDDEQHDPSHHDESVDEKQNAAIIVPPNSKSSQSTTDTSNPSVARPPRPKLEQSEFSFMLGQGDEEQRESRRRPLATSAFPSPHVSGLGKASLFGNSEGSRASASKSRVDGSSHSEGNDFDIGSLRRAPRAPK